ncbi:MAG: molybdopterin-dependent oxidoreductase, partial [Propionivibrio sp.]
GASIPAGLDSGSTTAAGDAIAETLLTEGKHAIFLGNVAEQSEHAGQIQALAAELAKLTGATFGFIGEAANSVGGYVAQAVPTALDTYAMFAQPRHAYVLFGVEPELDCHNPQLAVAALKQAALTVMLTAFKSDATLDYADALLPIAPFTETSGTFVSTEGRVQSFAGVNRPLGEARPGWKVLRVLGNLLALPGFAYASSEEVRDEVIPANTEFVEGLDNQLSEANLVAWAPPEPADDWQRIADVPIYFADPLVRRAPPLQKTHDAALPSARMNSASLAKAGVTAGSSVRIRQGDGEALLTAVLDEGVPPGCVRIAAAHAATAALGDMFGTIVMERA